MPAKDLPAPSLTIFLHNWPHRFDPDDMAAHKIVTTVARGLCRTCDDAENPAAS